MAIYKKTKGQSEKVPATKVKDFIKKVNGWNDEQYRKHYDLFKNKLRAYESYKRSKGVKVEQQSVAEVLYKEAKAKKRQGASYEPSNEMKRIKSFSAVSITKGRKLAQKGGRYVQKRDEIYRATTEKQFAGLIRSVPQAQEIREKIKDPVKQEEALKALAEALHVKQSEASKDTGASADVIPYGEATGSDSVDFDVDAWMEENGI